MNNPQGAQTLVDGVRVPLMMYGTAWKESRTQQLTELALQEGFRGIDTANQRRHYCEEAVGKAIAACVERGLITRRDLFLQTKFTFRHGQDERLPYDTAAPIPTQVEQSFRSSLTHLNTDYIDSLLLHGPTQRSGLTEQDWAAWRTMEGIHASGQVRMLGVSNVSLEQLRLLCEKAHVNPRFVQNRCYAVRGWDKDVRQFCAANGLGYQGFSLLTANRDALARSAVIRLARGYGRSVAEIVFRFAIDIGIIALTGTTNRSHMREDLSAFEFHLSPEHIEQLECMR